MHAGIKEKRKAGEVENKLSQKKMGQNSTQHCFMLVRLCAIIQL